MHPCPHCGKLLDSSTGINDSDSGEPFNEGLVPKPGDMTVCVYCSEVCTFDEEMQLRAATVEEIHEVNLVSLSRAQRVAHMFRKMREES